LILNKRDLVDEDDLKKLENHFQQLGQNVIIVSGITGEGIDSLKANVAETLEDRRHKSD
jgi:50S ribosomal subunit-associated GTPase HflX